jgi:uncharacterized membrane protein YbhN (UPF0104 family)
VQHPEREVGPLIADMDGTTAMASPPVRSRADLIASSTLSYGVGALLLGSLVYAAGPWNIIANTRVLDLLVRSGIVALTDADSGYIRGVPQLHYYLAARDPVDWIMVAVAAAVLLLFWGLKTAQFHNFARVCGVPGGQGEHGRAYLYGQGLHRLLPFNLGNIATVSALQEQGASPEAASQVVFLGELSVAFEIAVFALIGLFWGGWTTWLAVLVWSFVILGVAWLMVRPRSFALAMPRLLRRGGAREERAPHEGGFFRSAIAMVRALPPSTTLRLGILGLAAFALEDIAAFLIAQAFTSTHVILHATTFAILMGVIGSYIARFIPISPGGIGQFEWGFAAALYLAGVGLPEAATIAILDNVLRYITGTLFFGGVALTGGVKTNLRKALALFRGDETTSAGAIG